MSSELPLSLLHLPSGLPVPADDEACAHLPGLALPAISLPATDGSLVDLSALGDGRTVIYCYPRTGVPGEALPDGWDAIPGARGCTPQACAFRDRHGDLRAVGVRVFGLSTQDTPYQQEMARRLHLPYRVLSDAGLRLASALRLPTLVAGGMVMIRRLTLVVRAGRIEHVFYPVFPPDRHAAEVLAWLGRNPTGSIDPVASAADIDAVRALFREYAGTPGISVCLSGFEREIATLPGLYTAPGGLLLARMGAEIAGVVGMYPQGQGAAELRRLYVRPAFRGHGLGRRLVQEACMAAAAQGVRVLWLETLESMTEAIALYRSLGFMGPAAASRPGTPMRFERPLQSV